MLDFIMLLSRFFMNIFGVLSNTIISFGGNFDGETSLAGILFACLTIGFAASAFWKGAKSQ